MYNTKKILVIIPAYNEEDSIENVIKDVKRNADFCDILVINDGSRDNTLNIVKSTNTPVIDMIYNVGIGAGMQTGYIYAKENDYDIAVQLDGDGQHDCSYIESIIKPIVDEQSDMVIGSRYVQKTSYKSSLLRRFGMIILSGLIRIITGKRITDTTSGFRAINKKVINQFAKSYPSDYPEPDVIVRLHKLGLRILEVPVQMRQRQGGTSSITPIKSIFYMVKVSLAIIINSIRSKKCC